VREKDPVAMAPSTPVAEETGAAVTVIVVGAMPVSGKTVVPGLAPLARRLESKLAAASGEIVCVTDGRVIVIGVVRTVAEALEVVAEDGSRSGNGTLSLVLLEKIPPVAPVAAMIESASD
jgi:hypothetical protein